MARLIEQESKQKLKIPRHVGIIPDGNRRFAKRLMLDPWKGHELGMKKFQEILEWCKGLDIKIVTIYGFSIENFSRPKKEFDFLMDIFEKECRRMVHDPKVHENRVRINVIGRISLLPEKVQEAIKEVTEATKGYDNYILNLALAYGGRTEIIDTTKKLSGLVKEGKLDIDDIDETIFSKNLYTEMPDVDLIIRTSEERTSGFLPWQSVYAEIIFLPDKSFPELTKDDFLACIREFNKRQRRFGK